MKLIIATIQDIDVESVSNALIEANFRVTRIASTGTFLRRGSSTLLIGVEEEELDKAIQLIRNNCTPPIEPGLRRGTLFVLDVERFEQL